MEVARACAMTPATSAQYPHPAHAKQIETATETIREAMSLAETAEKHIARLSKAR
jgi:hypothetical protein